MAGKIIEVNMAADDLDYSGMSKNDRKRIRALILNLADSSHSSWVSLAPETRERGQFNLMLIRQALELA